MEKMDHKVFKNRKSTTTGFSVTQENIIPSPEN
jgi:hypothetical protein